MAGEGDVALDTQRHVVGLEIGEDLGEDPLVWVPARAPHPDPPDTERNVSADLQELGADGAALSSSKLGALEADPPQLAEQDVRDARKPKSQLVGGKRCRARPIGEQTQLLLFDSVLHVTTSTVQIFVQLLC